VDAQIPDPQVQERLQGEGRGVFLLMWKGEVRAAFCHRRLREKPPWGGVSVLSESVASNEGLVEQSAQLLRAINWNGPAMVEFKEDRLGGRPHLMEINGRFWGSLQLAVDSGVDFPLLYLKLAMGEAVPAQGPYRVGERSRWLLADLDALVTRLRNAAKCDALCPRPLSRSRCCADFLRPGAASGRLDVFRREDAAPAWLEWKQYLRTNLSWVLGPTHD